MMQSLKENICIENWFESCLKFQSLNKFLLPILLCGLIQIWSPNIAFFHFTAND